MIRLILIVIVSLLFPVVSFAQTPTPTINTADISATYNYDLTPVPQFDPSMSHDDILRTLGVSDSYQTAVYGDSNGLDFYGHAQLSEVVPSMPLSRSSSTSFISCSDRNGTTPVAFQNLDGTAATVINWDWPTYSVCGNLSGPACAAALGDKTTYTYYYSDMGRGSWFTVPYLSFLNAPTGAIAPPSAIYSSSPEWSVKLFFETGSTRKPEIGVIPTWRPEVGNPNAIYQFLSNIWNPKEIGKIFDSSVSGRRWYLTNLQNDEVGNFAVQFRMPKIYLNTFKPRLSVCAMRPYQYSPQFAQTAVAQQTQVAATRTSVAGDVVSPPAPTTTSGNTFWSDDLNTLWNGRALYAQCNPQDGTSTLSHCYIETYGAAGNTPTTLRSGLRIEVLNYDPVSKVVGSSIAFANFTTPRQRWSRLTFEDIRLFLLTKGREYNPYRMIVKITCPTSGNNIICVPGYGSQFQNMYYNDGSSNHMRKHLKAPTYLMVLSDGGFVGASAYLTATAYKNAKTPTRTVQVMTAVRTITPRPTMLFPTLPPLPPTINATVQTGATRTAIVSNQRTATAAAAITFATQTALANTNASQTAVQATQYSQATRQRQTATAQTRATQTTEAVATQYLAATLTSIAGEVGTAQATQQAQLDRTATVAVLISDGEAVFRFSTSEQIELVEDVASVGPGSVISMIVNAFTAFDRGLYNTPCNGFPTSIGGSNTGAGSYQITQELAQSLCEIRIWLDAQTSVIPLVRQILSVIFVILIAIMVLRIIRGSSK